ncbi:MAG: hypothetical protein PF495_10315 [Spirochaetales bacterium]|jgi:hypothetical protein|nr:hypothetical protein [Spirochaetales bacterium]
MAPIKSAFEIAMERAEGIETNPEEELKTELIQSGKRLAGSYLFDIDTTFESVQNRYKALNNNDLPLIRLGLRETIIANITLPQTELYVEDLGKLKKLTSLLSDNSEQADDLFVQIDNLYQQYLQTRDQLEQRVLEQYRPQLEQKQRMLSQQSGRPVTLRPEQDKDFVEMLQQTYKRLDDQFQEALDQLKDSISSLAKG